MHACALSMLKNALWLQFFFLLIPIYFICSIRGHSSMSPQKQKLFDCSTTYPVSPPYLSFLPRSKRGQTLDPQIDLEPRLAFSKSHTTFIYKTKQAKYQSSWSLILSDDSRHSRRKHVPNTVFKGLFSGHHRWAINGLIGMSSWEFFFASHTFSQ